MKEINLNIDNIVHRKVGYLTDEGVVPQEYTERDLIDYEITVPSDGKITVKLDHKSDVVRINPLLLKSINKILEQRDIPKSKIKDSSLILMDEVYSVELHILNGRRDAILFKGPESQVLTSTKNVEDLLEHQTGIFFDSLTNILYFVNCDAHTLTLLRPRNGNDSHILSNLRDTFKTMSAATFRHADEKELSFIDSFSTLKEKRYSTASTEVVTFPVDSLEAELQDKELLKQLFILQGITEEFRPFLSGDYDVSIDMYSFGLGLQMVKSMDFVINLQDKEVSEKSRGV